jgi:CheY-like chemotaxis protein
MTDETTGASTPHDRADGVGRTPPTTVLLTEDDDAFRETERLWLARDGRCDMREAANGREALAELDASVDVLVIDQNMPKVSGPEVVERLDETAFQGDVVVVSAAQLDDRLAQNDDVVAALHKPVSREAFVDTIARHAR